MIAALELDAERAAVHDAVASWCREHAGPGFERTRWKALAALGAISAGADGESGARELVASYEALGAAATAGPLVETVIALRLLPAALCAPLAAGDTIASVGEPPLLPYARLADHFIALDGGRAFRAHAEGAIEAIETLGGEPWGRVELVRDAELPGADAALTAGRLACAALLAGAGRQSLEIAAEHARTRKQFGRAIGEFQAVAHPLADVWTRLSATQALARAAAHDADAGGGEAAALAAAAWFSGRRSALAAAQRAHQTLGALGITLEGPLFELTRRIRQWASLTLGVPAAVELVRAHAGLVGDAS